MGQGACYSFSSLSQGEYKQQTTKNREKLHTNITTTKKPSSIMIKIVFPKVD